MFIWHINTLCTCLTLEAYIIRIKCIYTQIIISRITTEFGMPLLNPLATIESTDKPNSIIESLEQNQGQFI